MLGLRWADLDLDACELHVVQTLTTIRYTPVFSTPKTKRSRRMVYLDVQTVAALLSHRQGQRQERLVAGAGWDTATDLVFADELGRPLHPDREGTRAGEVGRIAWIDAVARLRALTRRATSRGSLGCGTLGACQRSEWSSR